ncbi:hypothetical protein DPMN_034039 [Dreissena polymorpha]|uniref:C1q domain-containing protein n=1 Tax=Dreissena polymorpha TaxID=45954 RepID=A0A9D4M617_DREPO|nr:hypothetical protein DPMN_034039 [Dreissena polymorpha]
MHNGNLLAALSGSDGYEQSSQTITSELNAGDEVWLSSFNEHATVYGSEYSSFSAFQL